MTMPNRHCAPISLSRLVLTLGLALTATAVVAGKSVV